MFLEKRELTQEVAQAMARLKTLKSEKVSHHLTWQKVQVSKALLSSDCIQSTLTAFLAKQDCMLCR